jgi:hypothetical protein
LYFSLKYNYNDQDKENKLSWACSTHGREDECIQGFRGKAIRGHTEDIDVDGMKILKQILEK